MEEINKVKFYMMEQRIKETTLKLRMAIISKDEADKILLDLFDVSCSEIINQQKVIDSLMMLNRSSIELITGIKAPSFDDLKLD